MTEIKTRRIIGLICIIIGVFGLVVTLDVHLFFVSPKREMLRPYEEVMLSVVFPSYVLAEEFRKSVRPFIHLLFYSPLVIIGLVLRSTKPLSSKSTLIIKLFLLGFTLLCILLAVWAMVRIYIW